MENRFLRITSNGFDVLELGYYINTKGVNNIDPVYFSVCQFYLKYSPDGREYFNFSNEDWKIPELDTTRTYFLNYGYDRTDAPRKENTEEFRSWHEGHPLHIAIQYSSNVLSFLVNGVPKYSYLILGNLFIDGNYTLTLGERFYDPIPVTLGYATNPIQDEVFFTISGLRFTNNSVYDTSEDANNNPWFENSLQPIPIALGQLEQPRCRVIDILRKSRSAYTDAEEIKWLVLFSQEVQNLSLEDFSLTQLNGLTGSTIKEIIPTNNSLVYEVVVQTGTGKGEIILNFIDRRTLFYKGTNVLISSFVGELSYEGQSYFINKTNPIPVVFSTTSPYVFDTFQVIVDLKYPLEKIGDIDPSKFSIVNGEIVSFSFIDTKVKDRLAVVIKPIERGAIYFQCQYSLFFTPTGLPSLQSNTLIRVFDAEAVVLLLPLNSITGLNDISPSQITFNQVVPNSVVFDNQVFPPGETSSLFVSPLLEQSGIFYKNFEITKFIQVSNFFSSRVDLSWQYEFFYRTTTNTNTLLIEFNKEGISNFIKVQNGKVIITSRIDGASSIIPTNIDNIPNQWNHFAVNYRNGIVRVYFNGERKYIGYIPLQKPFDCNIFIGYKETFVNFNDYHFSNLRVIVGKILYSNLTYTIPRLPYDIPLQIKELSTTIIYATIYSNNQVGNRAISGNNIFLGFNTVAPIKGIKVKINGIEKTANVIEPSHYTASFLVDDSFPEGWFLLKSLFLVILE
ncbi:MAG: hypothetical protein CV045_08450 [Cyanobacteria bacterium M5B4]|nr:MAG: hypothetical protein CV045_08450 [Cyanobacteria bacterium M5B4]